MARASRPSRQTSGWLPSATSRSRAHDVRAHDDGAHDDGAGRGVPTDPMTGRVTARARFSSRRGGRFAWRGCRGLRAYAAVGLRDPGEGLFDVFAAALPGGLAAGVTGDFCAHGRGVLSRVQCGSRKRKWARAALTTGLRSLTRVASGRTDGRRIRGGSPGLLAARPRCAYRRTSRRLAPIAAPSVRAHRIRPMLSFCRSCIVLLGTRSAPVSFDDR